MVKDFNSVLGSVRVVGVGGWGSDNDDDGSDARIGQCL